MKEVDIISNLEAGIDLKINEEIAVETGNIFESYSFWEDIEKAANRAMFRLKKENPDLSFELDMESLIISLDPDKRKERVAEHIQTTYPGIDAKKLINIIDEEVKKIELEGPDDNHPNPFIKIPADSEFFKIVVSAIVERYVNNK